MNFDQAFEMVIGHEGGFTNDARDRGNWTSGIINQGMLKGTKFGISAMAYPDLDILNLTVADAKVIYLRDYWNKLSMEELPAIVRFDLFDMAVNSGVSTAAKILQRACGAVTDGEIGPKTVASVNAMQPDTLDKRFNGYRLKYLCDIKSWPDYGKGWVRRVAENLIND